MPERYAEQDSCYLSQTILIHVLELKDPEVRVFVLQNNSKIYTILNL